MHENDVYKTTRYRLKIQKWYCPNCGALLQGEENSEGKTKVKCSRCGTHMTKYRANRQHDVIEMRIPSGCY